MTFSSDSSKIRDFRKQYSEGDGKWTSTHIVYLHGTGTPFRKEGCALCYMYISFWRRLLLLLILDSIGSLIPRKARIM